MQPVLSKDLVLAIGRYPGIPWQLALMQLHSDRQRAGLGALDERRRPPRPNHLHPVQRSKWWDVTNDRVYYRLAGFHPARTVIVKSSMPDLRSLTAADAVVETTNQPAREHERLMLVTRRELRDERDLVAQRLRALRRELRQL